MRATVCSLWRLYSDTSGVLLLALVLTYALFSVTTEDEDAPVVTVEKFELLTPRVPAGGSFTFRLWRKSRESCSGTGVVAFTRLDPVDGPAVVISARYPFATPGFNSPPPLVITRELPSQVTPGKWRVVTGVDSKCPTRSRYDQTSEFELEVTP